MKLRCDFRAASVSRTIEVLLGPRGSALAIGCMVASGCVPSVNLKDSDASTGSGEVCEITAGNEC